MNASRSIWLMRHPPVAAAFVGRCYGQSDVPLDKHGPTQAAALADSLQECGPITHLFSSDLMRCQAVAERLAARLNLAVCVDGRLRERHFGAWELQTWDDIYTETGDAMLGMLTAPDAWRPLGGETTFELRDRVLAWHADLPLHGTIVAITHGGPIAALRGTLRNHPVPEWPKLIPQPGAVVPLEA